MTIKQQTADKIVERLMTTSRRDFALGNLIYRADLGGRPAILSYGAHFVIARFDPATKVVTINGTKYRGENGDGLVGPANIYRGRSPRAPSYSTSTEDHKRAVEWALRKWDVTVTYKEGLK